MTVSNDIDITSSSFTFYYYKEQFWITEAVEFTATDIPP